MEKSERFSFWQFVASFTLPALACFSLCGLMAFALIMGLSLWLAVPLGLLIGGAFLSIWVFAQGGESSMLELNFISVLLLVLVGILVPVIVKVQHQHQYPHHRTHHQPAAQSASPQEKTLP